MLLNFTGMAGPARKRETAIQILDIGRRGLHFSVIADSGLDNNNTILEHSALRFLLSVVALRY